MSRFAINNPYFIVVICLIIGVVGVSSLSRMPIDMFPAMNIPVVVVATFYSGMPPQQIETDITSRFERFFKLGSGIAWLLDDVPAWIMDPLSAYRLVTTPVNGAVTFV